MGRHFPRPPTTNQIQPTNSSLTFSKSGVGNPKGRPSSATSNHHRRRQSSLLSPHTAHTAISVYSHLSEPLFDAASAWNILQIYPQSLQLHLVPASHHSSRLSLFHVLSTLRGRAWANKRTNLPQPKRSHPLPPLPPLPERRLTPLDASPPLKLSDRRNGSLSHMLPIPTATTTTAPPRSEQPHDLRTHSPLSASGTYHIPTKPAN